MQTKTGSIDPIGSRLVICIDELAKKKCPRCKQTHVLTADIVMHSGVIISCTGLDESGEDKLCGWSKVYTITSQDDLPKAPAGEEKAE